MTTPKEIKITKVADYDWTVEVIQEVDWEDDTITTYKVPSLHFAISILNIYTNN